MATSQTPSPSTTPRSAFRRSAYVPDDLLYQIPSLPPKMRLKLDSNEGQPHSLLPTALTHVSSDAVCRYPQKSKLERLLADKLGVEPAMLVATAGGDDALDRICRAFLSPGDEVIVPSPSFEMLEHYAKLTGATIVHVPWTAGEFPIAEVTSAISPRTRMIAIVSPNNPTGLCASPSVLKQLSARAANCLLLVDLAYEEFADVPLFPVARTLPNAIILRTLSKAWGLAGLRVGYLIAPPDAAALTRATSGPYMLSGLSIEVACYLLAHGESECKQFLSEIRREREMLTDLLVSLGGNVLPSQANFVLARFPDSRWLWSALRAQGIAVRPFFNRPGLEKAIRITCPGRPDDFALLSRALKNCFSPECVLFDMDGVLADVRESYRRAVIQTASTFGVEVSESTLEEVKRQANTNNDWEVSFRLISEAGKTVAFDDVRDRFEQLYQGTANTPGLKHKERLLLSRDSLRALKNAYPLGIVTGRPRRDAEEFLCRFDLEDCFAILVCLEDAPVKPNPEGICHALQSLNCSTGWYFGDTPDDMTAAHVAGMIGVGIAADGDFATKQALIAAGAVEVFPQVNDVFQKFKNGNEQS